MTEPEQDIREITDEQWHRIIKKLSKYRMIYTRSKNLRTSINALLWYIRNEDASWRRMPKKFGNPVTRRKLLHVWITQGTRQKTMDKILEALMEVPDCKWLLIKDCKNEPYIPPTKKKRKKRASKKKPSS